MSLADHMALDRCISTRFQLVQHCSEFLKPCVSDTQYSGSFRVMMIAHVFVPVRTEHRSVWVLGNESEGWPHRLLLSHFGLPRPCLCAFCRDRAGILIVDGLVHPPV